MRSDDGGVQWKAITVSSHDDSLTAKAVVGSADGVGILGTLSKGLFRTTDHGVTWTHVDKVTGLVDGLAIGPPSVVVGVGAGGDALHSEDRGASWKDDKIFTKYKVAGVATNGRGTFVAVGHGGYRWLPIRGHQRFESALLGPSARLTAREHARSRLTRVTERSFERHNRALRTGSWPAWESS